MLPKTAERQPARVVQTLAGTTDARFGEVFGAASDETGAIFVSDGANGKIFRVAADGKTALVTDKLDTPSHIALAPDGGLIVADAGTHTIKKINAGSGEINLIAGTENKAGFQDGAASDALFNAPVGVAAHGDKIYVADTYNDRIRVIENGSVRTIAENLNTPCGVAAGADGEIYVADTGNRQIKIIDRQGAVKLFAGTGERETKNGWHHGVSFIEPVGVTVDRFGVIYVADAGANAVRAFGRRRFAPVWETLSGGRRGLIDGNLHEAKFNRPTAVAVGADGKIIVADSANKIVRALFPDFQPNLPKMTDAAEARALFVSPDELKKTSEPRWTYNPPQAAREIAGTFGEVRGAIRKPDDFAYFHNGLDIAGAYGETARFLRDEKVLRPLAAENFNAKNGRELLRLPLMGYVHIRLGRDQNDVSFGDERFLFQFDANQKPINLRVRRGTRFKTGEAIGTLNFLNHVHLVAGETGAEWNAFAALNLPGVRDTVAPNIERVTVFDENWREIKPNETLRGKIRVVVKSYDQMDGNASRRRLGVFRLGYQVLSAAGAAANGFEQPQMNLSFDRLPEDERGASLAFAAGSQSGATGETVFNYNVTNRVRDGAAQEDFFDTTKLPNGDYQIRVFAADFFGNQTARDLAMKIQN